ncbi:MAG: hypothetical protein RR910_08625 [Acidaminococcaceae bacterium]
MAEFTKTLNIKNNGTTQTAKIYSTVAETGSTKTMAVKVGGVQGYIGLVAPTDAVATSLIVKKDSAISKLAANGKPPYTIISYTTPGAYTFTVPANITKLKVTLAGAGGGGGGAGLTSDGESGRNGGNGGSGELTTTFITVPPGHSCNVRVMHGGGGGSAGYPSEGYYNYQGEYGKSGGYYKGGMDTYFTTQFFMGYEYPRIDAWPGKGGLGGWFKSGTGNHGSDTGGNGTPGETAGNGLGAVGGTGGIVDPRLAMRNGSAGAPGWAIIEFGQGIE